MYRFLHRYSIENSPDQVEALPGTAIRHPNKKSGPALYRGIVDRDIQRWNALKALDRPGDRIFMIQERCFANLWLQRVV